MPSLWIAALLLAATPEQAAHDFYTAYQRAAFTGLPSASQAQALAPHFTPALAGALKQARHKQTACRAAHPDEKPPWIEGDLFSSSAEGFTRFRMRPGGAAGTVLVDFEYVEGASVVRWTDRVVLRLHNGRWRVDDVTSDNTPGSSLRQSLAESGC